jgi:hypothetical protein
VRKEDDEEEKKQKQKRKEGERERMGEPLEAASKRVVTVEGEVDRTTIRLLPSGIKSDTWAKQQQANNKNTENEGRG